MQPRKIVACRLPRGAIHRFKLKFLSLLMADARYHLRTHAHKTRTFARTYNLTAGASWKREKKEKKKIPPRRSNVEVINLQKSVLTITQQSLYKWNVYKIQKAVTRSRRKRRTVPRRKWRKHKSRTYTHNFLFLNIHSRIKVYPLGNSRKETASSFLSTNWVYVFTQYKVQYMYTDRLYFGTSLIPLASEEDIAKNTERRDDLNSIIERRAVQRTFFACTQETTEINVITFVNSHFSGIFSQIRII